MVLQDPSGAQGVFWVKLGGLRGGPERGSEGRSSGEGGPGGGLGGSERPALLEAGPSGRLGEGINGEGINVTLGEPISLGDWAGLPAAPRQTLRNRRSSDAAGAQWIREPALAALRRMAPLLSATCRCAVFRC